MVGDRAYCKPPCYAAAIEPTHVHLLLGALEENIAQFVGRLKGTSSSAALKLPHNRDRRRIWTAGYWKVFLFDESAMRAVIEYIESHNRRAALPAAFDWITPI